MSRAIRILLIEDDTDAAAALSVVLVSAEPPACLADTADQALAMLLRSSGDVVLNVDRTDALVSLRSRDSALPILAISPRSGRCETLGIRGRAEARRSGAAIFLAPAEARNRRQPRRNRDA
jgi:DNA-binding response OmpR family regulator